jgi:hypothetical protein
MKTVILVFALILSFLPNAFAEDSPAAVYQKFVEASRKGDVEGVIALSSAAKRKEAEDDMNKKHLTRETLIGMIKFMAPESYKIISQTTSPDQNKTFLFVEGVVNELFTLKGEKPKKKTEKAEIVLLKENGEWKIDQHCWGTSGHCEKEVDAVKIGFGKITPLTAGTSFSVQKGKAGNFSSVPTKANPYVVDLIFQGSSENPVLSYMLHQSPKFADFYLKVGDQKITPTAFIQDKEVKVMDPDTSYSHSATLRDKIMVSILFDVPKDLKGAKSLRAQFEVADQKYAYQIGD